MNVEHLPTASATQAIIQVEGLQAPVTLLHITDSHMNSTDESDGFPVLEQSWKEYTFDTLVTRSHFDQALAYANGLAVDGVVLTGDIINGATRSNLDYLESRLKTLRAPYLYTPGNHDWEYPGERWGEATRLAQYPKFERITAGNPACQAIEVGGILLLALDNSTYQISKAQLAFAELQLSRGMPTLLFMHIPISIPSLHEPVVEHWGSPIMMASEGWDPIRMKEWMVEPPSASTMAMYRMLWDNPYRNLIGLFCGHIHFSRRDMFGHSCQYVTEAGFTGGYRVIRLLPRRS
ncbi:metallophosphoesterase [Cohnella sp. AR92]|uniref:metallophosphoesterase family protein n=1 Tax=Cohnella sp. AR92 TaxID=648716 RepID=UPI000F8F282A|nr:metallophosphoesterase [Cohnella sp. AR92]RUS47502.1 hypothetical protein ELR57_10335 [Cohnella sp. AR92]